MDLWELNNCVKAYNKEFERELDSGLITDWRTAALTGAAFAGKLKRLNYYLKKDDAPVEGKELTDEQMRRLDEEMEKKSREGRELNG